MKVQRLDYGESESIARAFLDDHHASRTLPVPVELIIEKLGIHVVPVNGLRTLIRSQEGVLLMKSREILIDYRQYEAGDARFFFTLAHELGHYVLHGAFYETRFATLDEYKQWYFMSDSKAIDSLEIQANNFAGQILLPDTKLVEEWDKINEEYGPMLRGFDEDVVWGYVAKRVAVTFSVSEPCALFRIKFARGSGVLGRFSE